MDEHKKFNMRVIFGDEKRKAEMILKLWKPDLDIQIKFIFFTRYILKTLKQINKINNYLKTRGNSFYPIEWQCGTKSSNFTCRKSTTKRLHS